jgi:VWFA-related protein
VSTRLDGTEELMLVAIGEGAHITQPFTRDHARFLSALPRMSRDKELWEEALEHPSEHPLFASLEQLMEDLAEIAGPKALVLFTDGAWRLESTVPRLVAAAGQARVAVYPVLASGLTDGSGPYPGVCPTSPSGDPTGMQSLASATGGRATHVTNDLTLAAARAGRDLGCRYTLGVYDLGPKDDAVHEIGLVVRPAGLQVLHTGAYRFASWPK